MLNYGQLRCHPHAIAQLCMMSTLDLRAFIFQRQGFVNPPKYSHQLHNFIQHFHIQLLLLISLHTSMMKRTAADFWAARPRFCYPFDLLYILYCNTHTASFQHPTPSNLLWQAAETARKGKYLRRSIKWPRLQCNSHSVM